MRLSFIVLFLCLFITPSKADPFTDRFHYNINKSEISSSFSAKRKIRHKSSKIRYSRRAVEATSAFNWPSWGFGAFSGSEGMQGHPAGCPPIRFCGCGASVYLFGHSVRSLWPVAAWYGFPRAIAASRMAAVRPGHVMVLISHKGGSDWLVYDANSGNHQTRIHVKSIAGYQIVNPRG